MHCIELNCIAVIQKNSNTTIVIMPSLNSKSEDAPSGVEEKLVLNDSSDSVSSSQRSSQSAVPTNDETNAHVDVTGDVNVTAIDGTVTVTVDDPPPQTTATLNDVANASERHSIFNSVNFAGIIEGASDSGSAFGESDNNSIHTDTSDGSGQSEADDQLQQQVAMKTVSTEPRTTQTLAPIAPPDVPAPPSIRPAPPHSPRLDSSRFRSANYPGEKTLLDEIREVLAQSYLCFLLADLRHMSGTGQVKTKYEHLAIDSDVCRRHTADQIAGLSDDCVIGQQPGLSPAVIMAMLILEIRDTFVATAEAKTAQVPRKDKKQMSYATSVDIDTDEHFVAYENNETKKKLTEGSMESLMRCYSRMISEDLVTDIPNVRKRRTTMNLLGNNNKEGGGLGVSPRELFNRTKSSFGGVGDPNRNFNGPKSVPSRRNSDPPKSRLSAKFMLGSVVEETESQMSFEPRHSKNIGPSKRDSVNIAPEGDIVRDNVVVSPAGTPTEKGGDIFSSAGTETLGSDQELDSSRRVRQQFFSPRWKRTTTNPPAPDGSTMVPQYTTSLRDQLAHHKQKSILIAEKIKTDFNDQVDNLLPTNREGNAQKEFQELTDAFFDQGQLNEDIKSSLGATYTRKEMVEVMRNAVETRNVARLQFLSKFFKDGTLSKLLVGSHARVVWMNDWYPLKELTYAISVDARQRRVMVVFRGAITAQDWKSAFKMGFHKIRNPVKDQFDGKSDILRVFSGLYKYLFRKRKDTGTTKYDEIANMCHKYGLHHIGPDYKLFVTGHSLGGALTHFFSFFASTEERFTKNGPVKAIAFASPYIGSHCWADAIRYQERSKKLQLVQCRNDSDVIPRIPANFKAGKRGPLWRHVGIGVTLPRLPKKWVWWRKWKPLVHYWGKEKSCFDSTIHGYRRNIIFHFSYLRPWTLDRSHTLFELQDRLIYGEMNSQPGGDFQLLNSTLDELYEKLDDHDFQTFRKTKWWGGINT